MTKDAHDINDMSARAAKFAFREGFAMVGDRIIIVAGVPFGTPGATNMVRIDFVDEAATVIPSAAPTAELAVHDG